jgi:hypothetical protein
VLARARQTELLQSLVRSKFVTESAAAGTLAQPLRLSDGTALAAVTVVDLAPGPAFVWWQLALGAALVLLSFTALASQRRLPSVDRHALVVTRVLLATVALIGAAAIVRPFRTA